MSELTAHPPAEMETAHEPLEDEPNQEPRREVDTAGRRNDGECVERDGNVDESPERTRESLGEEVRRDGQHGTNEEEPDERVVPAV